MTPMVQHSFRTLGLAVFASGVVSLFAPSALAQNALVVTGFSGYGAFETAGVRIAISGDANHNATYLLTVQGPGDAAPRPVHPPARFDDTHLATSIFGLRPATTYTLALTAADPDGVTGGTPTATFTTRTEPTMPTARREVYVSPAGSDSAAGDAGHPFATIQHAVNGAMAGDVIHVGAGVYREEVSITQSGTASDPIVIQGDPGAILDGADPTLEAGATWNFSGGINSHPIAFDPRYVAIDGQRLWHEEDSANCPSFPNSPVHAPGEFCTANGTLYVKLADGSNASGRVIQAGALNTAVVLQGANFVHLRGLEIEFYGNGDYAKGIYLRSASDNLIEGNRVHGNPVNIWLKVGDRNLFQDNEVFDTSLTQWPWGDVKLHDEESPGIYVSDAVGEGTIIRRNHVTGTFDGIDFCGDSPGAVTTENDVYDNVIDDHLDDGSEADGACINARMYRNTFDRVHMGISLAPASPGPIFILRNVIYRYGAYAQDSTSTPFKYNSGYDPITSNVFIYHTTAVSEDYVTGSTTAADTMVPVWRGEPGHARGVHYRNNVLLGSGYTVECTDGTDVELDLDYDDLFSTDGSRFARWWDGSAVQHYGSITEFAGATGFEAHGISTRPDFAALATADLRPVAGSAIVDRGVLIPGIDDDFGGSAPDMGAFELGAAMTDAGVPVHDSGTPTGDGGMTMTDAGTRPDGSSSVGDAMAHSDGSSTSDTAPGSEPTGSSHGTCGCRTAGTNGVGDSRAIAALLTALALIVTRRRTRH